MADPALQALLDPDSTGRGLVISKRASDAGTLSHYYVIGNVKGVGKAMWVPVTTGDTDAQKDTAIRAAFGVS